MSTVISIQHNIIFSECHLGYREYCEREKNYNRDVTFFSSIRDTKCGCCRRIDK